MDERLLKKYDLFVFDWDGTLNSVKILRKINEKINPFWNYKKSVQSKVTREELRDFDKLTKRVKSSMNRKSAESRAFAPLLDFSIYLIKPKLHNDALEVLMALRKNRKKIALLTNGATWRVTRELEMLGIESYFEIIVSAQDLKILKPNPLGLNVVLALMKGKRDRSIYIGDMVDDILLAKYAKVSSCAVACGFDNYPKLKSYKPTYIFSSLEGLRKAL